MSMIFDILSAQVAVPAVAESRGLLVEHSPSTCPSTDSGRRLAHARITGRRSPTVRSGEVLGTGACSFRKILGIVLHGPGLAAFRIGAGASESGLFRVIPGSAGIFLLPSQEFGAHVGPYEGWTMSVGSALVVCSGPRMCLRVQFWAVLRRDRRAKCGQSQIVSPILAYSRRCGWPLRGRLGRVPGLLKDRLQFRTVKRSASPSAFPMPWACLRGHSRIVSHILTCSRFPWMPRVPVLARPLPPFGLCLPRRSPGEGGPIADLSRRSLGEGGPSQIVSRILT